MTDEQLIDHFAGLAMQAMISTQNLAGNWDNDVLAHVAKFAYAMAVQMVDQKCELLEAGVL
jgi:hypothetical protein